MNSRGLRLRNRVFQEPRPPNTDDDKRIIDDIYDQLTGDPSIDWYQIEVKSQDGRVTLEGTVNSVEEKRRAEKIAKSADRVSGVDNRIRVSPRRMPGREAA